PPAPDRGPQPVEGAARQRAADVAASADRVERGARADHHQVRRHEREPRTRTRSHGLRAFRNAAHGVSPATKPRNPSWYTTAPGSTTAPKPQARAPTQKSTSS